MREEFGTIAWAGGIVQRDQKPRPGFVANEWTQNRPAAEAAGRVISDQSLPGTALP